MDTEELELTIRVTVEAGYPREGSPLAGEIAAFCDRLEALSSVESVDASMAYPIRAGRRAEVGRN